jgi:hypothetical protein
MLADEQVDNTMCKSITKAVEKLADDEATARTLADLLPGSDIANTIHHDLSVRVLIANGPEGELLEVVKQFST